MQKFIYLHLRINIYTFFKVKKIHLYNLAIYILSSKQNGFKQIKFICKTLFILSIAFKITKAMFQKKKKKGLASSYVAGSFVYLCLHYDFRPIITYKIQCQNKIQTELRKY